MYAGFESPKAPARSDGNINDWAEAISTTSPVMAARLNESRSAGFDRVEALGLPRYKRITTGLAEFLDDPDSILTELDSQQFYLSLVPNVNNLKRFSKTGLSCAQAIEFAASKVALEQRGFYDAVVQQYFKNRYGGVIVINPDGRIYIEFIKGKQSPVAKGNALPEFTAVNDRFTGTMRYSFDPTELRASVYRTLQAIPHDGSGRETIYIPGYYEFVLVGEQAGDELRPIFFDYKDDPLFYTAALNSPV